MDRLLDPHTQKICDALLSDIINTVDNEETCTIKFFRKDLVTMTIWLFILKSYNEYKAINIEDIAREVAPSSRVSKPSLRLILENAKIKKFIRFVDNPKDNRSWIIEPEDITINEFKKWTQIFYNIIKIIFIIFFTYNCSSLPGISKNPKKQKGSKTNLESYTINNVKIDIIKINELNENQINKYNNLQIKELKYSIEKFPNIYNYKYEYALGSSDVVSINLTDTDDIDGSYTIGPKGYIDLPFIGKIKVDNLTLNQSKEILHSTLSKYYTNTDLQIKIEQFNSSKVYILGAVRNQITINLDQKPIRLIDAAIQASYNPNSQDKSFGSKGLLRRDNKVYKIDINNIFQSTNANDNFFLKKDDVLYVDRNSDAIHVFGEVTKPGVYFPNKDYSLTELISTAGLNNLTSNASKVYVLRENFNKFLKINIFQLDITNPTGLILGKRFMLQPKDIIFIPAGAMVKWNRVISLLIPQTDLFSSYNPIIQEGMKASSANMTP